MKRKIPCYCDNSFDIDVPEEIDLDSNSEYLEQIQNGTFFNFTCPSCGKKHKPEFPLSVLWPSKKLCLEVFPELERGEFYRQKKTPEVKKSYTGGIYADGIFAEETIVGYPELADQLAVIQDGFEPVAVEALKYFLFLKAEEQYPDDDMDIWYTGCSNGGLEFHIHGIRDNEVALMKIPLALYQKTLDDYKQHPKKEVFSALRVRTYLSVKNTMRPEELK